MFSQYRFSFDRDYCNIHGQVIIPVGTTGWVTLNGITADLTCDKTLESCCTPWVSFKFSLIKDFMRLEIPVV